MPSTQIGIAQWARMHPRLVELCRDRTLSAGDIAEILNNEFRPARPLSRHAVIGKVYRLGLRRPEAKTLKTPPPPSKPQPPPPPPELGLSIMQLTGSTCRWPVAGAGADMRYCGAAEASMPGKPYCREHAKMARQGRA